MMDRSQLIEEIRSEVKNLEDAMMKLNLYADTSKIFEENYHRETLTDKKIEIIAENFKEQLERLFEVVKKYETIRSYSELYKRYFSDEPDFSEEGNQIGYQTLKNFVDNLGKDCTKRVDYFGVLLEILIKTSFQSKNI